MYLKSGNKKECSGCTACLNICPKNAIKMVYDEEGFEYPVIDKEKCIECGACYKICPNVKKEENNTIIEAHGAKHKNENERITSRSGGVFIALSDYILKQNGVIYGVEFTQDFDAIHSRATDKEQRDKFKGSKYIQSHMGNIIQEVKKDLQNGKKVMFSGTPCQVAAVNACIPKIYQENLYTVDLICHGVPSKAIFNDFLKYIKEQNNKEIKNFIFRDKRFGWESHYETFIFEDDTELTTQYFRNLFYGHHILRPSCYNCNYANIHRPADITIADFWGIDKVNPKFMDQKGVSLAIINNEKGKKLFNIIKDNLNTIECSLEDCIKYTYTLNQPTPVTENRHEFWKDYKNEKFEYIIKKYATE
mgnify:CR=1 FL=1